MAQSLNRPQLDFSDIIARHGKWFPSKAAVVCGNVRLTWKEFNTRTAQVANTLLQRGLQKGEKVALLLQNSIATLELIVGVARAGGVIVPLNTLMARESVALMIRNASASLLIADSTTADQIDAVRNEIPGLESKDLVFVGKERIGWSAYEDWIKMAPTSDPNAGLSLDDTFNIVYSSGTTGTPKGIEHTHFARLTYCLGFGLQFGISSNSITILTTPLYANGTWMTMMPTLFSGGTLVVMDKFDAKELLYRVQQEKCTHAFMVPTQFIMTVAVPDLAEYQLDSLSVLICSGSPLSTQTLEEVGKAFPSASLYEVYGMSEGFSTCIGPAEREAGKKTSVGLPILDGDIRIIDDHGVEVVTGEVGEVVGYSSSLMKGYYRDPQRTDELIWQDASGRTYLRSGDLGRLDNEGYLYIVGRKKDMIISGGVNIFAVDLEETFMRHPEVSEVAVIGVPHAKWGETPVLLAIMKPGFRISPEELREWGNERLAKFQRVSKVEFVGDFPRNALGKILKRDLRDSYCGRGAE